MLSYSLKFFVFGPYLFFGFDICLHIRHMGASPWEDVSLTFMFPYDIDLWPQCQNGTFGLSSCPTHNFFVLFWHRLTRFSTCMYHDPDACRLTFDHKVKFMIFDMAFCSVHIFLVLCPFTLSWHIWYISIHHGTMCHIIQDF